MTEDRLEFDLQDMDSVSVLDELSLWSAPFGISLLDKVLYRRGIRALDIGCGLGFPLVELAMRLGDSCVVIGVDPWRAASIRVIEKLRTCRITNAVVLRAVAEQMPVKSSTLDLVVSNNGVNNVADICATFRECSRVLKRGGQFIFTFNEEDSFEEFYRVFRNVLLDFRIPEGEQRLSAHIYQKRKPLGEMKSHLETSGFIIDSISENCFKYKFADGSAMLRHFFISVAFAPSWKEIVPDEFRKEVFLEIEKRINDLAASGDGFSMKVPFATVDCRKK